LIAKYFAPLAAGFPGALGLTDDAAFLPPDAGHDTVVTVDAIVAGVHFLPDDPPGLVARKLVRVNLSDLAAKGAVPFAVLLSAAFPHGTGDDWLRAFADGLAEDLKEYGAALIGGDTVSTPGPLTLSLTALGKVEAGRGLKRSGACVGDVVWVSGTIGDGALGLLTATGKLAPDAHLLDRYRLPQPRVGLGPRLIGMASAAMDVSDGLVQDLGHMMRASGVKGDLTAWTVPLSQSAEAALARDHSLLATVLTGGDDYELLFTAPLEAGGAVSALSAEVGVALTPIGRVVAGQGVAIRDARGRALTLKHGGWRHFTGEAG
jgi:thiamine-monophosphate kinase